MHAAAKNVLPEYDSGMQSLDNKTAAAFIVKLQDHLESTWCR